MSTELNHTNFTDKLKVELIDIMANDDAVIEAAKVSTLSDEDVHAMETLAKDGFINYLMKSRHGSPFEHCVFKWRVHAPIFLWREFMRHRIASYNEQSGRYTKMPPLFYIPNRQRNMIQVGKPGHYNFEPGTLGQWGVAKSCLIATCATAYKYYEEMLEAGIAKEVARMALPLNLYSAAYVTMNARALMNYLSLRVKSDDATYPTYPMWEINQVANQMEHSFHTHMPITHGAFVKHGRVAP